jgi:hypothetical protein
MHRLFYTVALPLGLMLDMLIVKAVLTFWP